MAKFCCDDCREAGSICDFCINLVESEEALKEGWDGICRIDGKFILRCDGDNCKDFHCFRAEE